MNFATSVEFETVKRRKFEAITKAQTKFLHPIKASENQYQYSTRTEIVASIYDFLENTFILSNLHDTDLFQFYPPPQTSSSIAKSISFFLDLCLYFENFKVKSFFV
jgi:hypothetical protein